MHAFIKINFVLYSINIIKIILYFIIYYINIKKNIDKKENI